VSRGGSAADAAPVSPPGALVGRASGAGAFWQHAEFHAAWDENPLLWELLWALARRGQQAQAVDRFCLSNSESDRAIVDRRSRLGRLLPAGLRARIRPAGRRSYRLDLAPEEIALVQRNDESGLVLDVRGAAVS